ncbi:glutathione S-transferase family protein [Nitratireductor sp. XY-223]|uniref:glutathione S-transferase family protein n=1 Tax=Nitratireductor sp. XY-223 TaxID=2561926 RepID=UPI0010AAC7DE|nr:glutathione S-transferase family protein [Nitratireductor sp. XY-223]
MKLYSAPGTCATAMHIALEWAGAPYEVEHLDFQGMKSPEYLKLNPAGVVPTLVDAGTPIVEGAAILLYLTDKLPQAGLGPQPGDADRQELYRWLVFLSGTLHPYFWPHFMPMRFTTDENGHDAVREASHQLVAKAFTIIDDHLEGRTWLVGEERSVADAFLYAMASWGYGLAKPTGEYRNIHALMMRLSNDPAVLKVHAAQGTSPKAVAA